MRRFELFATVSTEFHREQLSLKIFDVVRDPVIGHLECLRMSIDRVGQLLILIGDFKAEAGLIDTFTGEGVETNIDSKAIVDESVFFYLVIREFHINLELLEMLQPASVVDVEGR